MTESQQLLKRYTEEHSEMAFTRLVELHVNLVYSTALRLVGGNAALAQDIAQSVFTTLAQKAATLPAQVVLSGWLYRHTTFVARQTIRTETRRQQREQTAAIMQANEWVFALRDEHPSLVFFIDHGCFSHDSKSLPFVLSTF